MLVPICLQRHDVTVHTYCILKSGAECHSLLKVLHTVRGMVNHATVCSPYFRGYYLAQLNALEQLSFSRELHLQMDGILNLC